MKNYRELLFVVVLGVSCGAYAAEGAGAAAGEEDEKPTSPKQKRELVLRYVKNTISSWTGGRFDLNSPHTEKRMEGSPFVPDHEASTRDKDAQSLKKLAKATGTTETTRLLQAPAR